ncbi:class I SAM-dependent rRNA methyltransferase [Pseudenhygromyxa sp. WMMC2535]|uniref:class I SAM-dependent rRNA methyltransferase n=1 Tax=Pseudenhygromyxa sp. WMMC2535 TaxID=2712867 RepID=UPI001551C13F|nr:class I SAM-dependent rRNA methyltransferase [Pseudenhygromyxa sp. WMMC2535]NVB36849.1 class I SAM-dependent rRNA methyltransferase [Pseudenhygromyxa sp. WMMC2535]
MTDGKKRSSRNAHDSKPGRDTKRGHAGARQGPRRGKRTKDQFKPAVRSRGAKVRESVARWLRAGHPWIFRDALLRPLDGVEPGALMAVADEDGNHLGYGLFEPEGAVALRMVSHEVDFRWDEDTMLARLRAAKAHRERYVDEGFAGASRLIHADGDGFPGLAVDRYGEFLLVYKYAAAVDAYLDQLLPLLEQEFAPGGIYLQDRTRSVSAEDSQKRPPAAHLAGKAAPPEFEVEEDGLRFLIDVTAPVSPGLFLDLREGRRMLERVAKGKRVLNLFSFTGALALRAVRGGAVDVTNVDAAARSHARCRQNLAASNMDPEACEALTGDVFKHLERFRQRERSFDLVVVDPPPFSTVKGSTFSALEHWNQLAEAIVRVVEPGGEILAVANAASLTEEEFLGAIGEGSQAAGRSARVIAECGLPPDFPVLAAFPEGKYLKVKLLTV